MSEEPTQPDEETEPEEAEDVPEPAPPEAPPETPEGPEEPEAVAVAEMEPKMDFAQFVSLKQLRLAPAAALRRWLPTQGKRVSDAYTSQEWEDLYTQAMAHH